MNFSFGATPRHVVKTIADFVNRPVYVDLSLFMDRDVSRGQTDHFRYSGRNIDNKLRFSTKSFKMNGYKPIGIQFIGVYNTCRVFFVNKAADRVLRRKSTNSDATILFSPTNWDNEENVLVVARCKEVYLILRPQ